MPKRGAFECRSSNGDVAFDRRYFANIVGAMSVPAESECAMIFRNTHHRLPSAFQAALRDHEVPALRNALLRLHLAVKQYHSLHCQLDEKAAATAADQAENENDRAQEDRGLLRAITLVTSTLEGGFKVKNVCAEFVVNLLFSVAMDEDLIFRALNVWNSCVSLMHDIFKRRKRAQQLVPSDYHVPWQPVDALIRRMFMSSRRMTQAPVHNVIATQTMGPMVLLCSVLRWFYDPAELRCMWEHLRVDFQPESMKSVNTLAVFELLLPHPACNDDGFAVVREIVEFLLATHQWYTQANWMYIKFSIFTRLAKSLQNRLFIWDEFASSIFNSILYTFRFPIGKSSETRAGFALSSTGVLQMVIANSSSSSFHEMQGSMIGFMLNNRCSHSTTSGQGQLWTQLRRFTTAVEVYMRPSSSGSTNSQLMRFFGALLRGVRDRVKSQLKPEHEVPSEYWIEEESLATLVSMMAAPVVPCIYSKSLSVSSSASSIIWTMTQLSPRTSMDTVLKLISMGLSTSTERHQTTAALELLTAVSKPLATSADFRPRFVAFLQEHGSHVVRCLDANDEHRAALANRLLLAVFNVVPVAALGDEAEIATSLIDAYFSLLKNRDAYSAVVHGFVLSLRTFFASLTGSTLELCVKKVARALRDRGNTAISKMFGALVCAITTASPDLALEQFLPVIGDALLEGWSVQQLLPWAVGNAKPQLEASSTGTMSGHEATWWVQIMRGLLDGCTAASLPPHAEMVLACAERLMRPPNTIVMTKMGLKIIQSLLRALTEHRIRSWHRHNPADVASLDEDDVASSKPCTYGKRDVDLTWTAPPPTAITLALRIADHYVATGVGLLQNASEHAARICATIAADPRLQRNALGDDVEDVSAPALRRHGAWMLRYVLAGAWQVLEARRRKAIDALPQQNQPESCMDRHWWDHRQVFLLPDVSHIDTENPHAAEIFDMVHDAVHDCLFSTFDAAGNSHAATSDPQSPSTPTEARQGNDGVEQASNNNRDINNDVVSNSDDESGQAKEVMQRTKSDSIECKCIKLGVKISAILLNIKATVPKMKTDIVRVIMEVAQRSLPSLDQRVSRLNVLLHAEISYSRVRQFFYKDVLVSTQRRLLLSTKAIALSRFPDVQEYGLEMFDALFTMCSHEERVEHCERLISMLREFAARAATSAAIHSQLVDVARGTLEGSPEHAAVQRFRIDPTHHEMRGLLCLLGRQAVAETIGCSPEQCFRTIRLLIEMPDMERKSNEQRRDEVIRTISAYTSQNLRPTIVAVGFADSILAPSQPESELKVENQLEPISSVGGASPLAATHVTRLLKYLQMIISTYCQRHSAPLSVPAVRTVMNLMCDTHSSVRRYASSILSVMFRVMKPLCATEEVLFPRDEATGQSMINIASPTYFGSHNTGNLFPPLSLTRRGEPVRPNDELSVAVRGVLQAGTAANGPDKSSWLDRVVDLMVIDGKKFSSTRMQLWKGFAQVVGPQVAVPALLASARRIVDKALELVETSPEAKNSYFALGGELTAAAMRASKFEQQLHRAAAFDMLLTLVTTVCKPSVPFEVLREVISAATYALVGHATLEEHTALLSKLLSGLTSSSRSSQDAVRWLSFIATILYVPPFEFVPSLVKMVIATIQANQLMLLHSSYSQVRSLMTQVLGACFLATRTQSSAWEATCTIHDDVAAFTKSMLSLMDCSFVDEGLVKSFASTDPCAQAEGDQVDAAISLQSQAAALQQVDGVENLGAAADRQAAVQRTVALAKTIVGAVMHLSTHIVDDVAADVIRAFSTILQLRLPESDDLYAMCAQSVRSFAFSRMSPATTMNSVRQLAEFLLQAVSGERARHASLQFLIAIRIMAFQQQLVLDRVEIFAAATPAVLRCLGHSDRRVRDEGMTTMSVLVKVAPAAVVASFLSERLKELRQANATAVTPPPSTHVCRSPPAVDLLPPAAFPAAPSEPLRSPGARAPFGSGRLGRNPPACPITTPPLVSLSSAAIRSPEETRRLAAAIALCSALSAYPDSVPKFAPKVMMKLAPLVRDRHTEVKLVVKETFQLWWQSHRDRWLFEHQHHFSEQQREELSELFGTPNYYV